MSDQNTDTNKGKKMLEKVKSEVKKQNKEKGIYNMKKTILVTIASTLTVLAIMGGIFYLGTQFGAQQEKAVNTRIVSEAKSLAKTVEPSKQ